MEPPSTAGECIDRARNPWPPGVVYSLKMRNEEGVDREVEAKLKDKLPQESLPRPTTSYRRRAWLEFQRAIDPLAPPKPLRIERRH